MVKHNALKELVYIIIKQYASEEKPITPTEIEKRVIKDYPDHKCERKTIKNALVYLRDLYGQKEDGSWKNDNIRLHYDVIPRASSPKVTNYWFEIINEGNSFSDEELLCLIDAVQFSKHISYKNAEEIIKKLIMLSDNSYSDKFQCYKNIGEDYHTLKKDFFLSISYINEAINQHKKISFFNNHYGTDKKLHPIGDKPTIVSPYRIVTSDGNYFLLCRDDFSPAIKSYRIDRISVIEVLDEDYASSPEMGRVKSHPEEYLLEHRFMNTGKPVEVTLIVDRNYLGEVFDAFGTGIRIDPSDDTSNSLTIHVKSSEKDIIDWALRNGSFAEITKPDYLRLEMENLALLLSNSYISDNQDEYYEKRISKTIGRHWLELSYVDLNKYDSYKTLNRGRIEIAIFRHNWINDFSFLKFYAKHLKKLHIERNSIKDTSVISELKNLETLGFVYTGITDLGFLNGLDNLESLYLRELSLENIEAVYSMKKLKRLLVNRTVASLIDEKRLKEAYGEGFRYTIDETNGLVSRHKRTY